MADGCQLLTRMRSRHTVPSSSICISQTDGSGHQDFALNPPQAKATTS
jgi:hypothetical protein